MKQTTTFMAPYPFVAILDPASRGVVPEVVDPFAFTDTCITIGCNSSADGPTICVLGDVAEVDLGEPPLFEGSLVTPGMEIRIVTAEFETLLSAPVTRPSVSVKVWTNRPFSPDFVIVGFE